MIWRPAYHKRIAQLADGLTTALSFVAAYAVWQGTKTAFPGAPLGQEIHVTPGLYWSIGVLSFVWVLVFVRMGAYAYQRFTSLGHEVKIVVRVSALCTLFVFAVIFVLRLGYIPRTYVFVFFLCNALCLVFEKAFMFKIARMLREAGRNRKRLIVVGNGPAAHNFVRTTGANLGWGLDIVGVVALNGAERLEKFDGKPLLGSTSEMEEIISMVVKWMKSSSARQPKNWAGSSRCWTRACGKAYRSG